MARTKRKISGCGGYPALSPRSRLSGRDDIAAIDVAPYIRVMDDVFLLHHVRSDDEYADDAKLIGVYRSHASATAAVERLRHQPGFRNHPDGWDIQKWELDKDHWEEGFSTLPDADLVMFRFEPGTAGDGKLVASAEVGEFFGTGEAWFDAETLQNFANACASYPLQPNDLPSLRGGYWDDSGNTLKEVHLSVLLEPHDVRGTIRATVQLGADSPTPDGRDLAQSVTVRFVLAYDDLQHFVSRFQMLISGRETAVALRSSL